MPGSAIDRVTRERAASSSPRVPAAGSGSETRDRASTDAGGDVHPPSGDVRPTDVERTDDLAGVHGTKAFTTLHGPPRTRRTR